MFSWKLKPFSELSKSELIEAYRYHIKHEEDLRAWIGATAYCYAIQELEKLMFSDTKNQNSKPEERIRFFITDKSGETEEINLYWFEENHIRYYSDLECDGYYLTVDINNQTSIIL